MAAGYENPTCVIDGVTERLDVVIPALSVEMGAGAVDYQLSEHCLRVGGSVLALGVLQGAIPLMGHLEGGRFGTTLQPVFDITRLSSRPDGTGGPNGIDVVTPHSESVKGKHVVVIEDLVDSGLSLAHLLGILVDEGARELTVASLLMKPDAQEHDFPDGTTVISAFAVHKSLFVTGYGMDIGNRHRGGKAIRAPRSQIEQVPEDQRYSIIPYRIAT